MGGKKIVSILRRINLFRNSISVYIDEAELCLSFKEEAIMKRKMLLLSVVIAALIFAGWGSQEQSQEPMVQADGRWGPNKVVVMTRNIYVGGNVDRLILPGGDPIEKLLLTIAELQYTNFPERAVALAKEIKW